MPKFSRNRKEFQKHHYKSHHFWMCVYVLVLQQILGPIHPFNSMSDTLLTGRASWLIFCISFHTQLLIYWTNYKLGTEPSWVRFWTLGSHLYTWFCPFRTYYIWVLYACTCMVKDLRTGKICTATGSSTSTVKLQSI